MTGRWLAVGLVAVRAACGEHHEPAECEGCDGGTVLDAAGPRMDAVPAGPVCGDGVVEGAEECDDGNDALDDGCDNTCAAVP